MIVKFEGAKKLQGNLFTVSKLYQRSQISNMPFLMAVLSSRSFAHNQGFNVCTLHINSVQLNTYILIVMLKYFLVVATK